jgi:tol-pal system protein YbgF
MAAFDLKLLPVAMKTHFSLPLMLVVLALPLGAAAQQGSTVYMEDRLNQLQQSLTLLTGQMEQLQYQNQQLQQQMEKMQSDYEFRLDQLEKGKGGGAPPPRAAGPALTAPPPSPQQQLAAGNAGMPPASAANADQLYKDAFSLLEAGDYAGAEKGFRTFVQKYPQHVLAGNAQYWLGETYYARRDYQNAMTAFAEGYKVYRNTQKGPDNLLKLGITLTALNRKSEACAIFARFAQDYPKATDLQKRRVDQERQRNSCG